MLFLVLALPCLHAQIDLHLFLGMPVRNTPAISFGNLTEDTDLDAGDAVEDDVAPPPKEHGYVGVMPEYLFQVWSMTQRGRDSFVFSP